MAPLHVSRMRRAHPSRPTTAVYCLEPQSRVDAATNTDVHGGRSGAGTRTDRHPVRSGQRADGRNRNENPVAGRGPRAGGASHVICRNRQPAKRLATQQMRDHIRLSGMQALARVGRTIAGLFVAEIGDVTRFRSAAALCSWAGVMGAAVVLAAVFAVLVFAGLFTVSSGVGDGHRTKTLVQQAASTPDPPAPSTTTAPPSPDDTAGADSPRTAAHAGRSPIPSSGPVAMPRTTAGTQVPAPPSFNSNGSQQLSSASSPPPSGAPSPAPTTAPTGSSTCHGNSKKVPRGQVGQASSLLGRESHRLLPPDAQAPLARLRTVRS
jgi:hypothetical protein